MSSPFTPPHCFTCVFPLKLQKSRASARFFWCCDRCKEFRYWASQSEMSRLRIESGLPSSSTQASGSQRLRSDSEPQLLPSPNIIPSTLLSLPSISQHPPRRPYVQSVRCQCGRYRLAHKCDALVCRACCRQLKLTDCTYHRKGKQPVSPPHPSRCQCGRIDDSQCIGSLCRVCCLQLGLHCPTHTIRKPPSPLKSLSPDSKIILSDIASTCTHPTLPSSNNLERSPSPFFPPLGPIFDMPIQGTTEANTATSTSTSTSSQSSPPSSRTQTIKLNHVGVGTTTKRV